MIQCPSCGEDVADDSAHCGFCGGKIETGAGKKTMMGFAALTGDTLRQAAEEARQAREAADAKAPTDPVPSSGLGEQSESKLKLPKPAIRPQPAATGAPSLGSKLSIPKPGTSAPPEASDAKTAVMPAVDTPSDTSPTTPEPAVAEAGADTMPDGLTPAGAPAHGQAEDTLSELLPPPANDGPSEFGGGGGGGGGGPSEFGGGAMDFANDVQLDKKKSPAAMIAMAVAAVMLLCCVLTVLFNVVPALLVLM